MSTALVIVPKNFGFVCWESAATIYLVNRMGSNLKDSDFGELAEDKEFIDRIRNFDSRLKDVTQVIDDIMAKFDYKSLSPEDKVRHDLFLAFTINSLYWFYLRTQGKDPNQDELKTEINRVKEYMSKSRKLYEKKHLMPRLDKATAGRFVRSGLWDPENRPESTWDEPSTTNSLKRKRTDSESE